MTTYNLAVALARRAKYTEAEQMLRTTLEACRRVLGSAHPQTRLTEHWLEHVRSSMRAEQPTRIAGKAAARRNDSEHVASPALSPTALAEAEARARLAEAELLAMLDLEEPEAAAGGRSGSAKSKMGGKAKGKGGKR